MSVIQSHIEWQLLQSVHLECSDCGSLLYQFAVKLINAPVDWDQNKFLQIEFQFLLVHFIDCPYQQFGIGDRTDAKIARPKFNK